MRWLGLALALLLAAAPARADTWNVDNFCACVRNTDGGGNDVGNYSNASCQTKGFPKMTRVVWCEDAEDPGYGNAADGAGAWSDEDPGRAGTRGAYSAWSLKYGRGANDCGWTSGQPSSPTRGATYSNGYYGASAGDWEPSDLWQANSFACMDMHHTGEAVPANVSAVTVHSGSGIYGEMNQPTRQSSTGSADFGAPVTTISVARAYSFSSNYLTQRGNYPAKFDELMDATGNIRTHWDMMGSADDTEFFPFGNFALWPGIVSGAVCESAVASAVIHVGQTRATGGTQAQNLCSGVGGGSGWISLLPSPASYTRTRDWPDLTTWHAPRGMLKGLGTSNLEWKVWFDNQLVLWVDGIDSSQFSSEARATVGVGIDQYLNRNTDGQGVVGGKTTENVVRWIDNWVVRGWTDAQCAADGAACGAVPATSELGFAPVSGETGTGTGTSPTVTAGGTGTVTGNRTGTGDGTSPSVGGSATGTVTTPSIGPRCCSKP